MSIFYKINNALLATLFAAFITACGGGGGGLADIASTILSGSVGDGPIVGATVVIRSADGTVLATTASNDNANFNVSVKAKGKDYPLVIETSGGIDLVTGMAPDFDMTSIASAPSQKRVNVNPFSTMIEKVARTMPGGLRITNIDEAKNIVLSELNFGLDASLIPDPITATITGDNVALMVKASETMAEMIRRTRDTYGSNITGSDVIDAMVADLADGKVDGSGLAGTNAHISAVSNIVTSQVLLEAMNNNLRVNGDIATNAMDYAIGVTLPEAPSTAITQNVVINQAMITQATNSIEAALAIAPSTELTNLLTAVENVSADSLPEDIPSLQSSDLDSAIIVIETASTSEIETVNTVASTADNNAPTLSGTPATSVAEGSVYSFILGSNDIDGDVLAFSIANKPAWVSFNTSTGAIAGTPGYADAGTYNNIVITVSDGIESTSMGAFGITVTNLNRVPSISGTADALVLEGTGYSFTPGASDTDGDSLAFSITNKPSWANFNTSTGALTGTPGSLDVGVSSNITIGVSDGVASTYLGSFSITVVNANRAPSISGTPASSVIENSSYSFTPSANDADGDTLTFSIVNKPGWATFNSSTGALTGTPGYSSAGVYSILISVSDGVESASLSVFSITVSNLNRAPSISGTPASSVLESSNYSFSPGATDADGDALTFSIANMPAWASFNTSTGALTGTPGASDVGTASNIVISVSDGTTSIYLSAFSIGVVSYGVSSATLNWTPPTTKTDGSALDDLAGYKIRYGTASGSYTDTIDVTNAGLSSYVVENLTSNTYYFVVTAYNTSGTESVYSGEVSKTIQ